MNRDSVAIGGGLAKLKGQSWKIFIERTPNGGSSTLEADDDDAGILLELGGDQQKHTKSYASASLSGLQGALHSHTSGTKHAANVSEPHAQSRTRGSVMRLDKADMGLYGICPETDPFYAVICDICGSVVKPQGLQKHMTNRHHSYINHTTTHKLSANGTNTTTTGSSNSSSTSSSNNNSNSSVSEHLTGGYVSVGTLGTEKTDGMDSKNLISSSYDELPATLLDTSAGGIVPPVKVRSSGSGKVKSKSTKSGSTHGGAAGGSGGSSSKSSVGYAGSAGSSSNSSSLSTSFSKASISTSHTAATGDGGGATSGGIPEFGGAIGAGGVPLVLMNNCSVVLEKKSTFTIGNAATSAPIGDATTPATVPSQPTKSSSKRGSKQASSSSSSSSPSSSKTLDKLLAEMRAHGMAATTSSSGAAALKEDTAGFMEVIEPSNGSSAAAAASATVYDAAVSGERRNTLNASGESSNVRSTTPQSTTEGSKSSHHGTGSSGSQKVPSSESRTERSKHKISSRSSSHSSATGGTSHQPSSKSSHRQGSLKHGQSREPPAVSLPTGMQNCSLPQQHQQILMPQNASSTADMNMTSSQQFPTEELGATASNTTTSIPEQHTAIVMDPNTNLLKISDGTMAGDGSQQQQQYATTNLVQAADGLTVTLPLSVISSMNLAGTNLVSMAHGSAPATTASGPDVVGPGTGPNGMLPPGVVDCGAGAAVEQTAFIPAELIDQIPLVAANGTELHDAAYRLAASAAGTASGQGPNGLADLSVGMQAYSDQINYTLQSFAQSLPHTADGGVQQQQQHQQHQRQHQGQTGQVDLVDSIDDIVPTINLLPTATNPLVIPQLQGDLADSIILTPNQLSSLSLVDQHFIDNISALKTVSEIDPLTVNGPVDISKLMLLKKVDEQFLREKQQQQQQQQLQFPYPLAPHEEPRGVKMWYSALPKPLHVNSFQLRRLAGGYVMNRKLLNVRRNLVSETNLDGKRHLQSPSATGTPHSPLGGAGTARAGARSGSDILLASLASPTGAGKGKAAGDQLTGSVNGGLGSPTGSGSGIVLNRSNSSSNRGQRRLIMLPQQQERSEKSSCLSSNAYFKNLITSMQQQQQQQQQQHQQQHQHQQHTKEKETAKSGTDDGAGDRAMHSMKRSASSLTMLSNKRLKIINNLHNSTAPPPVLLQGSGGGGKVKSKVL
uniref:Uncharacterized protein n=1 Tax=Anopheles dirus TaxID=7168 RepID=A0A182NI85_9DIPT